jgi:hypothetical protein|tara:strand:+ start:3252 stop:3422 length:171 start_codon:yes stop_codon:yes gene_type:complete
MSYKGQYLRGEKWYLMNRDADGNLLDVVKNNAEKMKDVDLYLKAQVKEETKSKGKK